MVKTVRTLLCLALMFWCAWAHAAINISIQRLSRGDVTLKQLQMKLDQSAKGQLSVHLKAASVDMATLGWHHVGLKLAGVLSRLDPRRWQFDGTLALSGAPGGLLDHSQLQMTMDTGANNMGVKIVQKSIKVNAALPLDQLTHARIKLDNLPLSWLQGLLARAWSGQFTSGRLDGVVALDLGDNGIRTSGDISLANAGFDSTGGKLAGEDLDLQGRMTVNTTGKHPTISTDLTLHGGQLLLGPLYVALPKHDVHVSLRADMMSYGTSLRQLHFTDPGALHLAGAMIIGSDGSLRNIHLSRFSADLPAAYQRYGKAWLATLGYGKLRMDGKIDGSLWMDSHGLREFRFDANDVDVRGQRLAVQSLDGALDWQRGSDRPPTTLSWHSLGFYDIALGAAKTRWQTRSGTLTLLAPLRVPVLGGHLHVRQLSWKPQSDKGQNLQTSLAMTDISVSQLCKAFGWPQFPGTMAGAIPGLHYVDDHIELEGGLTLSVFGGHVDVTRLALQHPFGDVPVLAADVQLRQLNLAAMTSVFDFGNITGRLNGDIDNLRLVDWKPVAFEASFETTGDGGTISQRAVHNITALGGGGMASGLQGAVLKLFDSFGYRRIGLSCTLQGSVCHMKGLKPVDNGYLIVEGRGLPHLSVIGHEHDVSWPTLVSRLKAAINSGGPVVK